MDVDIALAFSEEIAEGLRLAGFKRVWYPEGKEEDRESLREWFLDQEKEGVGIIFIGSSFYKWIEDEDKRLMMEAKPYPLVVTVPEGEGKEDPISKLIKRAIGIEIKR